MVNETIAAFGRVDILFNNAGVYVPKNVVDTTRINSWDFEFLPAPVSVQDAVRSLLAMPVKTR